MDTTYRKNLKAVLTASKDYTDNSIEKLKWELGTYDLSVETINGTTMLLPTPANTIQATMVRIDGASEVVVDSQTNESVIHNLELSGLKVDFNILQPSMLKWRQGNLEDASASVCCTGYVVPVHAGTYTINIGGNNAYVVKVASSYSEQPAQSDVYNYNAWRSERTLTFTINQSGYLGVQLATPLSPSVESIEILLYDNTTIPIDLTTIEDSGGNKLFADGSLKGVGNVADEITPYKAIKRIDSRAYQSGDEEDTSVLTDGTTTLYPLATPIEADIDLSQLVKFEAYSNGSITLVNTNNQDTASTIKYLKEVAK